MKKTEGGAAELQMLDVRIRFESCRKSAGNVMRHFGQNDGLYWKLHFNCAHDVSDAVACMTVEIDLHSIIKGFLEFYFHTRTPTRKQKGKSLSRR